MDVEKLIQDFHYNPITGDFVRVSTGKKVGTIQDKSRTHKQLRFYFDGKTYLLHRGIWAYVYGKLPEGNIDHINGNVFDNRICNLRIADDATNNKNKSVYRTNKSGISGVFWSNRDSVWVARIEVNGSRKHIGTFSCLLDAASARISEQNKLGFTERHGR